MKNDFMVNGEITTIFLKRINGDIIETKISTSDLERVKEFPNSWVASFDKKLKSFYVTGKINVEGKRKTFSLHRWLFDRIDGFQIDHINHDTLDNTRANLAVVSTSQNQLNRKGAKPGSKTGIRGVTWNKNASKWQVQMMLNGKKKYFGIFENIEDAKKKSIEIQKQYITVYSRGETHA